MRSIFAYDRYCRRKRHQEDQSCNGSASDRWHSDCKYPGNYSDTSIFVLWHTEGVNITSNSHDTERVRLNAKGIITGVVAALAVGLPVFAYGSVLNSGPYKTLGSLLTVLLSGIIALAASGKERRYAR